MKCGLNWKQSRLKKNNIVDVVVVVLNDGNDDGKGEYEEGDEEK